MKTQVVRVPGVRIGSKLHKVVPVDNTLFVDKLECQQVYYFHLE